MPSPEPVARGRAVASRPLEGRVGIPMIDTKHAYSGFSVDDVAAAKAFYAGTLGMDVIEADGMLQLSIGAGKRVLVYPKGAGHVPATYTVLNFPVDDVDA